jgi:hypothetical protein
LLGHCYQRAAQISGLPCLVADLALRQVLSLNLETLTLEIESNPCVRLLAHLEVCGFRRGY